MFSVLSKKEAEIEKTRWIESLCGPPGQDWASVELDPPGTKNAETIFHFRFKKHAELFDKTWNQPTPIFQYGAWKEFCIGPLGRDRMDNHWRSEGWTPTAVISDFVCVFNSRLSPSCMTGGRRVYRPSLQCWFFEFSTDAFLFWIENVKSND